eukprot:g14306.t1
MEGYTDLRTLKQTIYGKVKLCAKEHTGQLVGIKCSSKRKLAEHTHLEDPRRERHILQLLSRSVSPGHEYVLKLLDFGSDEDWEWTVLEYCGKGELYNMVSTQGAIDLNSCRKYFPQIIKGMDFIHSNGLCHLDVSLENILLADDDSIRLCDFGLALEGRHFRQKRGKPGYIAPEVFAGREYDGRKADIWSAGVSFFTMLVGFPPYETPDKSDDRYYLLIKGVPGLKKIFRAWGVKHVPPLAIDLLSHMLCPAAKRWTTKQLLEHPFFNPQDLSFTSTKPSAKSDLSNSAKNGEILNELELKMPPSSSEISLADKGQKSPSESSRSSSDISLSLLAEAQKAPADLPGAEVFVPKEEETVACDRDVSTIISLASDLAGLCLDPPPPS